MGNIVWFLDLDWIYMSLIAAGVAAGVHMIASIVAALRIGRCEAFVLVVLAPIYTFVSCTFYTIILAISVGYTYLVMDKDPSPHLLWWGLGFGGFYLLIKVIVSGYMK